ncbi:MAG TPA: YebC/PmpR family DNA-binding transcriptional regulator, partial [Candidatus Cloacimonadota bacterium]|nr:YebC/PmpR family DNA-binding transcriptional regulator [Candidatus Cloacimonadota bacterium]
MSGHNKWSSIKHKKGAADAKRGKIFTRLVKEIILAARDGGGDLSTNPRLRTAVQAARGANMPKDNIDKAIKRGTGEIEGVSYEEITYEGYGHGGAAIIVDTMTDNKNRTVAEIRHAFSKYGGTMAESGAVSWNFEQMG